MYEQLLQLQFYKQNKSCRESATKFRLWTWPVFVELGSKKHQTNAKMIIRSLAVLLFLVQIETSTPNVIGFSCFSNENVEVSDGRNDLDITFIGDMQNGEYLNDRFIQRNRNLFCFRLLLRGFFTYHERGKVL